MQKRNHFMPLSLLQSQLHTLEEPKEAVVLHGHLSLLEMINHIKKQLDD
jgi:gluconate kinase